MPVGTLEGQFGVFFVPTDIVVPVSSHIAVAVVSLHCARVRRLRAKELGVVGEVKAGLVVAVRDLHGGWKCGG